MTAWHGGDALVLGVAAQNKNTIVVVHSVGPLIVEPWIDHPNVTAVCSSLYITWIIEWHMIRSYGQVYRALRSEMLSPMSCMAIGTRLVDYRIPLLKSQRIIPLSLFLEAMEPIFSQWITPKGK